MTPSKFATCIKLSMWNYCVLKHSITMTVLLRMIIMLIARWYFNQRVWLSVLSKVASLCIAKQVKLMWLYVHWTGYHQSAYKAWSINYCYVFQSVVRQVFICCTWCVHVSSCLSNTECWPPAQQNGIYCHYCWIKYALDSCVSLLCGGLLNSQFQTQWKCCCWWIGVE